MLSLTEKILSRPDAFEQIEALNKAVEAEKKRRHAFREWIEEDIKAEFINGETIIHSPVKKKHWSIVNLLSRLLSTYVGIKELGIVGTEKVMISLTRNDYEPDICFFKKEKADQFTADQLLFPAPDLVVEILSKKTEQRDRTIKKEDYAHHGISEYWIIDPNREQIEQYLLINDTDTVYFEPSRFLRGEEIESRAVKGFKISTEAIFDDAANINAMKNFMKE